MMDNFELFLEKYIEVQKKSIYNGHKQVELSLEYVLESYKKMKEGKDKNANCR